MTTEGTAAVQPYLRELKERLVEVLGLDLVGVYLHGSAAMGAFVPTRSDVDVLAVAKGPLAAPTKAAVADALSESSLPCPGVGLGRWVNHRPALGATASIDVLGTLESRDDAVTVDVRPSESTERSVGHSSARSRPIVANVQVCLRGASSGDQEAAGGIPMRRQLPCDTW
jgi:hypothetical protein